MKDALGHGSVSNGQAARSLASGPKSAPVPIHSAWDTGRASSNPNPNVAEFYHKAELERAAQHYGTNAWVGFGR